ncbi:MAG: cysteine desulfurase NifS [Vulcanimicrobiaceae bacterium]
MRRSYLDNGATTRVDPKVVEAMLPFFTEQFGNASSKHDFGEEVGGAVRTARRQLKALIGAALDEEIVFTSSGTEADNTALLSALETQTGRNEVITSQVEHPAILALCEHLEKTGRAKIHRIPVDGSGRLDLDAYRRALSSKVACVSLMWANNETGVVFPVEQLAASAHEAGALFHSDAVQAVGKIPIDVKQTQIDLLSLSAHKFHGPKGIGALYVRKGVPLQPLIRGGRQERGRRAGTENVPAIAGLGKAAELARHSLQHDIPRVMQLRDGLERRLVARIDGAMVVGGGAARIPTTLNLAFDYLESDSILVLLNRHGIAASSGSACASGSMEPSHVLRAMKVPYTAAHGAVRFSLSRENTAEDVDRVVDVLPEIVSRLREPALALDVTMSHGALGGNYA